MTGYEAIEHWTISVSNFDASCPVFTGIPVFLRVFSSVGVKFFLDKSTLVSRFHYLIMPNPSEICIISQKLSKFMR
jgi:hypothetical protein